MKALVNSRDRSALESTRRLTELMAQRADADLTPLQCKAKVDIEKLKGISGKFFDVVRLTKQYTLSATNRPGGDSHVDKIENNLRYEKYYKMSIHTETTR